MRKMINPYRLSYQRGVSALLVEVGLRFPAESRKSYFHLSFFFFISRNFGEFRRGCAIF